MQAKGNLQRALLNDFSPRAKFSSSLKRWIQSLSCAPLRPLSLIAGPGNSQNLWGGKWSLSPRLHLHTPWGSHKKRPTATAILLLTACELKCLANTLPMDPSFSISSAAIQELKIKSLAKPHQPSFASTCPPAHVPVRPRTEAHKTVREQDLQITLLPATLC